MNSSASPEAAIAREAFAENLVRKVIQYGKLRRSPEVPEALPFWLTSKKGRWADDLATELGFEDSQVFMRALERDLRSCYSKNGKPGRRACKVYAIATGEETGEVVELAPVNPAAVPAPVPSTAARCLVNLKATDFQLNQIVPEGARSVSICGMCRRTKIDAESKTCLCGVPYCVVARLDDQARLVALHADFSA